MKAAWIQRWSTKQEGGGLAWSGVARGLNGRHIKGQLKIRQGGCTAPIELFGSLTRGQKRISPAKAIGGARSNSRAPFGTIRSRECCHWKKRKSRESAAEKDSKPGLLREASNSTAATCSTDWCHLQAASMNARKIAREDASPSTDLSGCHCTASTKWPGAVPSRASMISSSGQRATIRSPSPITSAD